MYGISGASLICGAHISICNSFREANVFSSTIPAVCALVGATLMGPRVGRFDKDGKPVAMPGHSVPLSALGGLVLVFGFFACNGTKQVRYTRPGSPKIPHFGTFAPRQLIPVCPPPQSLGHWRKKVSLSIPGRQLNEMRNRLTREEERESVRGESLVIKG